MISRYYENLVRRLQKGICSSEIGRASYGDGSCQAEMIDQASHNGKLPETELQKKGKVTLRSSRPSSGII
jgi:hypothetical protein